MGGISGSKQKSQQQATQSSSGWTDAASQSLGGSSQNVWGGQVPALESLYANAQSLLGSPGMAAAPQQFQNTMGQGVNAWAGALNPGQSQYFDASLNNAIDAATRGFTQNVLPSLQDAGIRAGAVGSPRAQLAQGQAAGQFGEGLQNMVAQMANQQYGMDRQLQGQALGMTPQMAGSWFAPLSQAASMIGGPTVLGQSANLSNSYARGANQSTGQSSGGSSGKSMGLNFGK
jgi:hypothetical protein